MGGYAILSDRPGLFPRDGDGDDADDEVDPPLLNGEDMEDDDVTEEVEATETERNPAKSQ